LAADHQVTSGTKPGTASEPQTFRSVTAVIIWWVWVAFAVANLVDLVVQGHDHLSLVAAGILVLVTSVAYVTAQRPRVISSDRGITVRNPLRDHRVPWGSVIKVDLADLLRVHCRLPGQADPAVDDTAVDDAAQTGGKKKSGKVISAWAVHYSRRRQFSAEAKAVRQRAKAARGGGMPFGTAPFASYSSSSLSQPALRQPARSSRTSTAADTSPEAEAERIVTLLNERIATEAPSHESAGSVVSTWNWSAIAALGVSAVFLLICCLV
jgi:Bacterial PH domain